jgi:crotonobetainyl-CoA:carnitine CoA-transferase CaiB-like acyl-CoA transferase
MKLGEVHNAAAAVNGRPLDGVRVLALEQYVALPFMTNFLSRLGAEVVKIEPPGTGEQARAGMPGAPDASGRPMGASFWRYNLGKKSVAVDFRNADGQALIRRLVKKFDFFCENLGPGRMQRYGLDYATLSKDHPRLIYLALTGFGAPGTSPFADRPAMAGVPEAMSGAYEFARKTGQGPLVPPFGPIGDTGSGAIATIGALAAIMHRERTGLGQFVDIAMYDAMLTLADLPPNFWSLGMRKKIDVDEEIRSPGVIEAFRAKDGFFTAYMIRRYQCERMAAIIGRPDLVADERLRTPYDWADRTEELIRPAIEAWAKTLTKHQAADRFMEGGVPSAPCNNQLDVIKDPHVKARRMLVEMPRGDGNSEPVLVPGNPLKLSAMAEGPEQPNPLLGEHTDAVLARELGLDQAELAKLRESKVIE